MQTYTIKRCSNCSHCFKSKRSKTGYSCEVWGHDDFACDTILEGYCHKFKALPELDSLDGVYMFKTEGKAKVILNRIIWIAETYREVGYDFGSTFESALDASLISVGTLHITDENTGATV